MHVYFTIQLMLNMLIYFYIYEFTLRKWG